MVVFRCISQVVTQAGHGAAADTVIAISRLVLIQAAPSYRYRSLPAVSTNKSPALSETCGVGGIIQFCTFAFTIALIATHKSILKFAHPLAPTCSNPCGSVVGVSAEILVSAILTNN